MAEYFEVETADDLRIDRADVAACTDEVTLAGWFTSCRAKAAEISEFITAFRHAQLERGDWYERAASKVAFLQIMSRVIETRMLDLGMRVPYPPADPRCRQLRVLERKLQKLKQLLAKNGIDLPTEEASL